MALSTAGLFQLTLLALARLAIADFRVSFSEITAGRTFELTWDAVDQAYYPLYIQGTLFNDTTGGINSFKTNITDGLTGNNFTWTNAPYPMRFISTAKYELELKPQQWNTQQQGKLPLLAKSGLFAIREHDDKAPDYGSGGNGSPMPPTPAQPGPGSGQPGEVATANMTLTIAVCLGLGIPGLITIAVLLWWMRRRRKKRIAEKRRRQRRETFVIE